jgi:hypothetical protein
MLGFTYGLPVTAGQASTADVQLRPMPLQDFPAAGQAQQLSADVTHLLSTVAPLSGASAKQARGAVVSYEDAWRLIRPLLRVLMWLLPEHVAQPSGLSSTLPGAAYVQAVATVGVVPSGDNQGGSRAVDLLQNCMPGTSVPQLCGTHIKMSLRFTCDRALQ